MIEKPKPPGDATKAAKLRLQTLSVVFVGILSLALTLGAFAITVFAPSQTSQVWPVIMPLLTTAMTSLIWWTARGNR